MKETQRSSKHKASKISGNWSSRAPSYSEHWDNQLSGYDRGSFVTYTSEKLKEADSDADFATLSWVKEVDKANRVKNTKKAKERRQRRQ